jgi:hypothetical protein
MTALPEPSDEIEKLNQTGQTLAEQRRFAEAAAVFRDALGRAPERFDLMGNLGSVLVDLNEFGEALALFRQAFAMAPRNARVVANVGNFLDLAGALDEALVAYDAAQSLSPDDLEIRCNHAMTMLRAGRLREGWALYECRRTARDPIVGSSVPRLPPLGEDTDLTGRRILLFHEQGFGDSLQMLRYVPLLAARGATVLLRMPPALTRLAQTVAGVAAVVADNTDPAGLDDLGLDYTVPMMSLPLVFDTVLETIPAAIPYLRPPEDRIAAWRDIVAGLPRPRIGLVWAGSPGGGLDHRRSLGFDRLKPLFDTKASFVSLQIGTAASQWAPPPGFPALDPSAALTDFAETAALIANLDLVISADTSVVHLAGALGKPVWVLNRFSACWRWLNGRDDSPWYPSLRLFHQPRPGDWDPVVAAVAAALRKQA